MNTNILKALEKIVGRANVSAEKEILSQNSKDWSFHQPVKPEAVIWPRNTKQVSEILKLASKKNIAVTARGGGSSLEGNPIPSKGGIVLNMTKMNKVLEIYEDDLQVRAQPGIIGEALNKKLREYNLIFPSAPGSAHLATLGGMIANNAGGMHAVKYGVVGDWVLGLTVVLADGQIVKLGSRSLKSVSGYDLKRLFIASEGTLGIITEAVLKLTSIPKTKTGALVAFSDVSTALKTNLDILKSGLNPASIEYMPANYMHYVNAAKETKLIESPTVILEFHGGREIISNQLERARKICKKNKCLDFKLYQTESDLRLLWNYRRAVRPALEKVMPGMAVLSAEVGMPIGKTADFLKKADDLGKKYGHETIIFGHLADGNFHGWALYKKDDFKARNSVEKLNAELINFAIKSGGTTTGEHGIGIGKRKFLAKEHASSIKIMREIKRMLDPKGILNPGKIFLD